MTVELHLGDCREVLATLPDNSVDAVVTDPPYELSDDGKHSAHGVALEVMTGRRFRDPEERAEEKRRDEAVERARRADRRTVVLTAQAPQP